MRRGSFQRKEPGDRVAALRKIFPRFPETKQGGAQAETPVGIACFDQISSAMRKFSCSTSKRSSHSG